MSVLQTKILRNEAPTAKSKLGWSRAWQYHIRGNTVSPVDKTRFGHDIRQKLDREAGQQIGQEKLDRSSPIGSACCDSGRNASLSETQPHGKRIINDCPSASIRDVLANAFTPHGQCHVVDPVRHATTQFATGIPRRARCKGHFDQPLRTVVAPDVTLLKDLAGDGTSKSLATRTQERAEGPVTCAPQRTEASKQRYSGAPQPYPPRQQSQSRSGKPVAREPHENDEHPSANVGIAGPKGKGREAQLPCWHDTAKRRGLIRGVLRQNDGCETSYQHNSNVARHAEFHSAYICTKCIGIFPTKEARESHRCGRCQARGCKRHISSSSNGDRCSKCLFNKWDVWEAIYEALFQAREEAAAVEQHLDGAPAMRDADNLHTAGPADNDGGRQHTHHSTSWQAMQGQNDPLLPTLSYDADAVYADIDLAINTDESDSCTIDPRSIQHSWPGGLGNSPNPEPTSVILPSNAMLDNDDFLTALTPSASAGASPYDHFLSATPGLPEGAQRFEEPAHYAAQSQRQDPAMFPEIAYGNQAMSGIMPNTNAVTSGTHTSNSEAQEERESFYCVADSIKDRLLRFRPNPVAATLIYIINHAMDVLSDDSIATGHNSAIDENFDFNQYVADRQSQLPQVQSAPRMLQGTRELRRETRHI